jgi:hypothetical protein
MLLGNKHAHCCDDRPDEQRGAKDVKSERTRRVKLGQEARAERRNERYDHRRERSDARRFPIETVGSVAFFGSDVPGRVEQDCDGF